MNTENPPAAEASLRDMFAAKAMQAIVSNISDILPGGKREQVAATSYQIADAMLKERAKNP